MRLSEEISLKNMKPENPDGIPDSSQMEAYLSCGIPHCRNVQDSEFSYQWLTCVVWKPVLSTSRMYATTALTLMAMVSTLGNGHLSGRVYESTLTHFGLHAMAGFNIRVLFINHNDEDIFELVVVPRFGGDGAWTARGHYTPTSNGNLQIRWDIPGYDQARADMLSLLRSELVATRDPAYAPELWDPSTFLQSMYYVGDTNQVNIAILPNPETHVRTDEVVMQEEAAARFCWAFRNPFS